MLRIALLLALAWAPLGAADDGVPGVTTQAGGAGGDPDRECVGVYTNTVPMTTYVNPRCLPAAETVEEGSPDLSRFVA